MSDRLAGTPSWTACCCCSGISTTGSLHNGDVVLASAVVRRIASAEGQWLGRLLFEALLASDVQGLHGAIPACQRAGQVLRLALHSARLPCGIQSDNNSGQLLVLHRKRRCWCSQPDSYSGRLSWTDVADHMPSRRFPRRRLMSVKCESDRRGPRWTICPRSCQHRAALPRFCRGGSTRYSESPIRHVR